MCRGTVAALRGFPVCCRCAGAACVGVGGPPAAWRAAAAMALAVALRMRSAGRAGPKEEVKVVNEDEDGEKVVVLGGVRCAAMRAGAALWAAAASAAATVGRMKGMSSGCGFGAGGWRGPAATWQPGGPIWSAAVGGGGSGLQSLPSGFGRAGLLQCVRVCGSASAGGNSSLGLHSGAGGFGGVCGGCVRVAGRAGCAVGPGAPRSGCVWVAGLGGC